MKHLWANKPKDLVILTNLCVSTTKEIRWFDPRKLLYFVIQQIGRVYDEWEAVDNVPQCTYQFFEYLFMWSIKENVGERS